MSEDQFTTASETAEGEVVVTATGEIDLASAAGFERELFAALDRDPNVVVVDLAGVAFLDSSGVNALVQAVRRAGDDTKLVVRSPSEACRRVFEATRLDEILEIRE
jgi:anti-sigma B factor antagonist